MMCLACAIILLHAVVPHYHHDDCGAVGLVFENEMTCQCENEDSPYAEQHSLGNCCHHEHHSHHPFDNCKLQELLSSLVLNTKDSKIILAALHPQQPLDCFFGAFLPAGCLSLLAPKNAGKTHELAQQPATMLPTDCIISAHSLRGPPLV